MIQLLVGKMCHPITNPAATELLLDIADCRWEKEPDTDIDACLSAGKLPWRIIASASGFSDNGAIVALAKCLNEQDVQKQRLSAATLAMIARAIKSRGRIQRGNWPSIWNSVVSAIHSGLLNNDATVKTLCMAGIQNLTFSYDTAETIWEKGRHILVKLTADEDREVRLFAFYLVGCLLIPTDDTIALVMRGLNDSAPEVREIAGYSLGILIANRARCTR